MAKRRRTRSDSGSNWGLVKTLAYWGILIAAIASLISFIAWVLLYFDITWGWLNHAKSICNMISRIALIIAALIPAYYYTCGKRVVWRVIYFLILIFIILGFFGLWPMK